MKPTVGAAGVGPYLAVVCENDTTFAAWLLQASPTVPSGGAAEALALMRMWSTVEEWNVKAGSGDQTIRLFFCAPHDGNQENRVFERRSAQAHALTEDRLLEFMAMEDAQRIRRYALEQQVVRNTWMGLGDAEPAALRAFDVALSCFAAAKASSPVGETC